MIQISGVPFHLNETWQFESIEKTIIQHMHNDPVFYSYYSVDELLFEIKVRKNIIKSANEMNQSQAQFRSFEYARCNPKYWQLTMAGGFLLRPDVRPADAILDIYRNSSLYAFECATACVIIYYHAILYSIGSSLFNSLFQNLYLYSWHTDPDLGISTFYSNHFLPGDVVYFNNPDFHPQTPWFRGVNAVLLNDGRFFGHGFGISTAEQIIQILNEKRKPGSHQSAYLTQLVTRPSFTALARLANWQTSSRAYKMQRPIVHHNKSSVSYVQYLNYLI
ncbi:protein-glutamine gamma-glutamyltransferase [Bacillus sp. DTU_2020_1000418_1_SI_GHA_SEK_038]|uniref:protein-glutamine gamma-glutamyltransferase n=1 Tax=Bacillus sp. DTU_2020_1000418_1_SI_GHA_SEK_038 TaxID=3077585 RepID=UPI0028E9AF4F|nr:protein-glutamine gamma-glutamyltransferase [Bacillus sp. DTU_2020_1000418_1_SI_GHA_SEK_038]WNS74504.1 protein-glutamine gamma-glutamyltransferase [Bacillus sp. DTU_2020_1000418_1_SI_GHA_SEK_038]